MSTNEYVTDFKRVLSDSKISGLNKSVENVVSTGDEINKTPVSKKKIFLIKNFLKENMKKRSRSQENLDHLSIEDVKQFESKLGSRTPPPPPLHRPPPPPPPPASKPPSQVTTPSPLPPPAKPLVPASQSPIKTDENKNEPPPLPVRNIQLQYQLIKSMPCIDLETTSPHRLSLLNKNIKPSAPFPSTGSLNLCKLKSLLVGRINENEFENTKLEKLFELLQSNNYEHKQDWLDAFSVNELMQQFDFQNKNLDLYNITFDDLKAIISKNQQDIDKNIVQNNTKPQIPSKVSDKKKLFEKLFVKKDQIGAPTNFKIMQHVGFSHQDKKLEVNVNEADKVGGKIAAKLESNLNSNSKMQIKALIKTNNNLNIERAEPSAPERAASADYSDIDKIINTKETPSIFPRLPSMKLTHTGSLNLNRLKQILYSKVYINGFENLKLGQIFSELPVLDYAHEKDWLDNFSVSQVVELLSPDNIDPYKITFDDMKKHILEKQDAIANLINEEIYMKEKRKIVKPENEAENQTVETDYDNNFSNTQKSKSIVDSNYFESLYAKVKKQDSDSVNISSTDNNNNNNNAAVDSDFEDYYEMIPENF